MQVLAFNRVSSASLQKQLFIVRTPCQPPPVTSLGPRTVQVGLGAAGQAEAALGAELRERSAVHPGPRDRHGSKEGPEAAGPGLRPRERGPRERGPREKPRLALNPVASLPAPGSVRFGKLPEAARANSLASPGERTV